ncbi:hypothetical protein J3Q64DRAFT_1822668 [Phycomyces blakesleeanus]|uniref:F-box domain-containing protein n=2 Tax=Phycomyces blakesleeanus TaxID=4837 RepID=A0A167MEB9_PHYB8|nr:hypothetical protein PHYBLDRAFT_169730 [Phycomyces blakesleeanus NRRL 1555(-)]OAD72606.1 hypothetical protein PHYBLDRAFT_169730 [Phycomyces blakesleeanus NRRL 1555(-)]|eukprot:XP_018290646.1 hypothetical protein PHYBLDRAFT_169730 [Phycomyces blakesleeanus NRRL 1555(-)]
MLASDLPFEILSQIAKLLLTDDKLTYILTCKGWKIPFQESLWENIKVDSMDKLKDICAIVNDPTAHVFKTFPNLKHLDMGSLYFYDIDISDTTYGPQWTSVTSLKLQIVPETWKTTAPFMIEVLRNIPNLQSLGIYPYQRFDSMVFDFNRYNDLHLALPQLVNFRVHLRLTDMHPGAVARIPSTYPALSWVYYFCFKYPNLQALTFSSLRQLGGISVMETNERNIALLRSLETVCFYTKELSEWSHVIFWELLCPSNVAIKSLKYRIRSRDPDVTLLCRVTDRLLQSFSTTLAKLSINWGISFNTRIAFEPKLQYSSWLVSLKMRECGLSIALDDLLDHCPSLEHFEFSDGRLYNSSPETSGDPRQHGLLLLILDLVITNVSVLNYATFKCKGLEAIHLKSMRICGSVSAKTRSLCIGMSCLELKTLILDHVKFYSSSEENMSKDPDINLILLSNLTSPRESAETIEKSNKDVNWKSFVEYLAWYHLRGKYDDIHDSAVKIRPLSDQESWTANEYFQVSQFKSKTDVFEAEESLDEKANEEDWKKDLCGGYVELRCSHRTKYDVPLSNHREFYIWPKSFYGFGKV